MGYPQIIHLNRIVHYRPSSLGYPHLWKPRFATSKKLRANENLLKNAGEPSKQRPWGSLRDKHQVVLWCSKRPSSFHNLGVNAWTSPTYPNIQYLLFFGCQNEQINYIFPYKTLQNQGLWGGTKPGSYWVEAVVNQMSCLKNTMNLQDKSPLRWPGTSKFTKKWCQCQKSAGHFHSCEIPCFCWDFLQICPVTKIQEHSVRFLPSQGTEQCRTAALTQQHHRASQRMAIEMEIRPKAVG